MVLGPHGEGWQVWFQCSSVVLALGGLLGATRVTPSIVGMQAGIPVLGAASLASLFSHLHFIPSWSEGLGRAEEGVQVWEGSDP